MSTAEDGMMFVVADQPLLTKNSIRTLVEMFYRQDSKKIVVPEVAGRPANPVIFPAVCRSEFAELQGDAGGRQLIIKQPERVCLYLLQPEDFVMSILRTTINTLCGYGMYGTTTEKDNRPAIVRPNQAH